MSDAQFDNLVRKVYKVRMTRGMDGTVLYSTLYSTDADTQDAFP